ncbi:uncharacterized protein EI90DRAFT_3055262 [Cantharellus anzutake]|uniref:uncharacterized protein n=1 Tax=Cantharellus anzutake TaxID=1750568 RepID=UPI0019083AA1|nr:uncharacterized protein EI90DRAFT_3055262 [Cantharellus anzutake]KAF8332359.1 hypothetical protein EI90DRAFT_3055262 [Cantharellus anzutake]
MWNHRDRIPTENFLRVCGSPGKSLISCFSSSALATHLFSFKHSFHACDSKP